jgi:hypothetical protein
MPTINEVMPYRGHTKYMQELYHKKLPVIAVIETTLDKAILVKRPRSYVGVIRPYYDRGVFINDEDTGWNSRDNYQRIMYEHWKSTNNQFLYRVFKDAEIVDQALWEEFKKKVFLEAI